MIVLAVAIAGSVALAARRNSTVDTSGRDSGAMSAPDLDDSPDSSSVQAGEVASEASGDDNGSRAGAEETGAAALPDASSGRGRRPPADHGATVLVDHGRRGSGSRHLHRHWIDRRKGENGRCRFGCLLGNLDRRIVDSRHGEWIQRPPIDDS